MRTRTALGSAVVLALAVGAAVAQVDTKLLAGKWESADKKAPLVVEFTADGKVLVTSGDYRADGTYKVEGGKLALQLKFSGEEVKETLTVTKLTADELVTVDSKNKSETLKRKK